MKDVAIEVVQRLAATDGMLLEPRDGVAGFKISWPGHSEDEFQALLTGIEQELDEPGTVEAVLEAYGRFR